ncbi:MAG TPA: serine O-acetyltransferase EpsC [Bacteroidales bacterium]|nr:serine O-acetyltransferase EpsC [Bacteroidales bacterium]
MNVTHSEKITKAIQDLSEYDLLKGLCHEEIESSPMPSAMVLMEVVNLCRAILFPGYFGNASITKQNLSFHIGLNVERLHQLLCAQVLAGLCFQKQVEAHSNNDCEVLSKTRHEQHLMRDQAEAISADFIVSMPKLRDLLATDVLACYNGDPAAESMEEIIYCYPAIRAISNYRIAHKLMELGVPMIPRMITEMAHSETGIDIHPGATIGTHFAIDHGTGVVIGATAVIGNNVKLYQGVTLGAKSFPLDEDGHPIKGVPRHPILRDNVVIYSNATILGRITIGENATVGGNIWVTEDVAPNARVVQSKAKK